MMFLTAYFILSIIDLLEEKYSKKTSSAEGEKLKGLIMLICLFIGLCYDVKMLST